MKPNQKQLLNLGDAWLEQTIWHYDAKGLSEAEIKDLVNEWLFVVVKYAYWMVAEGFMPEQINRGVKWAIKIANFDLAKFPVVPEISDSLFHSQ
jgi:hypothetical protein